MEGGGRDSVETRAFITGAFITLSRYHLENCPCSTWIFPICIFDCMLWYFAIRQSIRIRLSDKRLIGKLNVGV